MTAKRIIAATIPTLSPRPDCWFRLAEKLIGEGFIFNHATAEWSKGNIRGRICWNETKAWMRHPTTKGKPIRFTRYTT